MSLDRSHIWYWLEDTGRATSALPSSFSLRCCEGVKVWLGASIVICREATSHDRLRIWYWLEEKVAMYIEKSSTQFALVRLVHFYRMVDSDRVERVRRDLAPVVLAPGLWCRMGHNGVDANDGEWILAPPSRAQRVRGAGDAVVARLPRLSIAAPPEALVQKDFAKDRLICWQVCADDARRRCHRGPYPGIDQGVSGIGLME